MINIDSFQIPKVTTEFKINKDKRTVVCIVTTYNEVPRRLQKYDLFDEDYDEIDIDIRKYIGVAKCSPEDVWDERYGRRLAEYRATKKRQTDVNNELKKFVNGIWRSLINLSQYGLIKNPQEPKGLDN